MTKPHLNIKKKIHETRLNHEQVKQYYWEEWSRCTIFALLWQMKIV